MAMNVLGVGSGLDLNEILDKLEASEKNRLTPIKAQQKAVNNKISGFGKLKSALSTFNSATAKLQKKELFQARTVIGSDNYFTSTVSSNAQLGNYVINVEQLATAHSVTTNAVNDKNIALGNNNSTRTITIQQANGNTLNISLAEDETSLESIANAINQAKIVNADGSTSDSTVNATIVRSGTNSYQLVITSKETGEQQAITSISSDDNNLNSLIGFDINQQSSSAMSQLIEAKNAKFNFNGITINSTSNTVKDVIPGVDINLKAVTTTPQNLTITADNEKAQAALKEWVEAFNQLKSTISTLTKFTPSEANSDKLNDDNGPLIGNSTLRNIDQSIRSIFAKGQTGEYSVLAQIGINMDNNGNLVIKESQLEDVLKENSEAVATLFTGNGETGIANEIFAKVSSFIDRNGSIDNATDGLNTTLKSLDKRYEQINDSIDKTIDLYRAQFTRLDVLINELNSLSTYLTSQFDMMANLKK